MYNVCKKTKRKTNKKMEKKEEKQDRRVKCIYCNQPIHISKFAGISDKGMFCDNILCLIAFVREEEESKKQRIDSHKSQKAKR